jgi:MFS transporter, ACDE family, multidrug resistance protein
MPIVPRVPLYLSHSPTPRVQSFAALAALESGVRGMLISVMPLELYRAVGDAATVSRIYFLVGLVSLMTGLLVPWFTRWVPRRWMLTIGACLYLCGNALAILGGAGPMALALGLNAMATVTVFVCLNAYILDHIAREELGRSETLRMVYSATMWMVGPVLGVWLVDVWRPAPFLLAGGFALALIALFWRLRLGNGKEIQRARGPAANPLSYLGRFARQPRLIAGWLFAVIRSCGWWVYVVYLPIFCIEAGLGDRVGGIALSASNALLYGTPLVLVAVRATSVRTIVRAAFAACAALFVAAFLLSGWPWAAVACVLLASAGLVVLDAAGSLPFLMAVKPGERTEMAAVFSSFRDVSGILTPGVAYLVLLVAPVAGVFAACGAGMAVAWGIAGRLHPRLRVRR